MLGHVGRFNGQKNHRFLLEVFRALLEPEPRARLLLVGDGYLENDVRALAAPLGDRVLFTGAVPNPQTYLSAMDVMALPSLFEGFPTVLLEWQCAGLPALVSARVTDEAALTPLVRYLPLEAGAPRLGRALLELPRPERPKPPRRQRGRCKRAATRWRTRRTRLCAFTGRSFEKRETQREEGDSRPTSSMCLSRVALNFLLIPIATEPGMRSAFPKPSSRRRVRTCG